MGSRCGLQSLWKLRYIYNMIYEKRKASMFAEIEKFVGSSGVCNFFERIAHVKLSSSTMYLLPTYRNPCLHKKPARGVCREPVSFVHFPFPIM
jgi:hypothetical protein